MSSSQHDSSRSDSGEDNQPSLRKRRYRKEDKRTRHDESSSSSSSNSSSESSNESVKNNRKRRKSHRSNKKKSKKHRKNKDRKHRSKKTKKKNRHDYDRSRSRSHSPNLSSQVASLSSAPPGAHEVATSLTQLFESYPAMSSLEEGGVPLLFIQLSRGTEYNLSQMPDRNLAQLLEAVFESLSIHGMEMEGNGAWKWSNALTGQQQQSGNRNDLALLRLTRALLNGVGVTLERVEAYEQDQLQLGTKHSTTKQESKSETKVSDVTPKGNTNDIKDTHESEVDIRRKKRVERMTSQMLDRFDPRDSSSSDTSLAIELQGICNALMEGESIQLDGIENVKLKATLAQLFSLIGLEMVEMNDDDEVDEKGGDVANDTNTEKFMGYALPDLSNGVTSNLQEVLHVCRYRSSGGSESAPTSWMATNPSVPINSNKVHEDSSSDDDDGPAPLGTMAAVKAAKRKRERQIQNVNKQSGYVEGEREEWMMIPGEHDFLKGISKSTRGRTFKNEKMRGQAIVSYSESKRNIEQINPDVLDEVNAIQRAYEQSRGPSLLDAHRQKTRESTLQKQQQKGDEFTWSRDKNLEDGRRVDKNALHQVMGGARNELKSKFQGTIGGL